MIDTPEKLARRIRGSAAAWCAFALAAASVVPAAGAQGVREQLVGTYSLVRYTVHGDHPIGRISYDLLISLNARFDNPLLWERLAERPPAAASAPEKP
jgi:hypothetical protein